MDKKEIIRRLLNIADHAALSLDDGIVLCEAAEMLEEMPSAQPEIIRCKDCKWWDRKDGQSSYGYCHAIKHSHYSRNWEISIYRTYDKDFFCADAERRTAACSGEDN